MSEIGFQAAFFAHRDSDIQIRRRIDTLEMELKLAQSELEHAQHMITEIVRAVGEGKTVKVQDEWGDSVLVSPVAPSENAA